MQFLPRLARALLPGLPHARDRAEANNFGDPARGQERPWEGGEEEDRHRRMTRLLRGSVRAFRAEPSSPVKGARVDNNTPAVGGGGGGGGGAGGGGGGNLAF